MTKVLIGILTVALASSAAWANLANGDFENCTITNQTTWTAGTDALGTWYGGPGWAVSGASGSRIADQTAYAAEGMNVPAVRTLVQALPIAAGSYNWTLRTRNNDNNDLYGLVVLLANNNATLNLSGGGPFYPWLGDIPANTKEALHWDPEVEDNQQPSNPGSMMPSDGSWNNISENFTISASDATAYKYVIFVAAGNVSPGSLLGIDTMATDLPGAPVPEPITMTLVGMGIAGLGGYIRRRTSRPQA